MGVQGDGGDDMMRLSEAGVEVREEKGKVNCNTRKDVICPNTRDTLGKKEDSHHKENIPPGGRPEGTYWTTI